MNREKVRFHHMTGSRSYVVHCHALNQADKYKDVPPDAFDLFKECHCSRKTGFSEPVKEAIEADMEALLVEPEDEGQSPKSANEVVAQVLGRKKFLQNVGLEPTVRRRSSTAAVNAPVHELEAELEAEKLGSAELRDKLQAHQDELENVKKKLAEIEVSRAKELEDIEKLKKATDETHAFLPRLLNTNN